MNQGLNSQINAGRPFTAKEARDKGISHALLSFHCQSGRLERLCQGVYAPKGMDISPLPEIEGVVAKP